MGSDHKISSTVRQGAMIDDMGGRLRTLLYPYVGSCQSRSNKFTLVLASLV